MTISAPSMIWNPTCSTHRRTNCRKVIFIEPTYQDSPHTGFSTDDHAPAGISNGQEFLMQVYNAVIASPAFWKTALMVITYDEHGGFFDHVSPPRIQTEPPDGAKYSVPFSTL